MKPKMKRITTSSKELYRKLNMLHFSPEVLLKGVKKIQIEKIVRRVNKDDIFLEVETIGNYLIVRKKQPINFSVYLNNSKKIYI